ncbi:beta-1,3-galactosyltransferase 5 isoform X2 [Elephas maximus indicus]|uniref:beta-1,3-galactosyltransferase 5 isoform X2 n=1 Tax=Elephas maximus indicus TaxID=99487 RepID=UPI002115DA66|nr:beta-1,3-galactosyltransferase 5 isoform X2 [Elephas maximus indicus]
MSSGEKSTILGRRRALRRNEPPVPASAPWDAAVSPRPVSGPSGPPRDARAHGIFPLASVFLERTFPGGYKSKFRMSAPGEAFLCRLWKKVLVLNLPLVQELLRLADPGSKGHALLPVLLSWCAKQCAIVDVTENTENGFYCPCGVVEWCKGKLDSKVCT